MTYTAMNSKQNKSALTGIEEHASATHRQAKTKRAPGTDINI
jgi:hypothetical protein